MDEYNELFSLVRETDLLNNEERIKLKLYLVNTKDKFNKYKSTLDKIKEYNKKISNEYEKTDMCEYCDGRYAVAKHNLKLLEEVE